MTAHISDDGQNREESVAEHTKKTVFLCRKKGERVGISQVMSLCALLHDMGKNKKKFDDYIHADKEKRQKLRGTVAHATTGAKYICEMQHKAKDQADKIMVEMISYAIAAHHGLFDRVTEDCTDLFFQKTDSVEDYEESCRNAQADYLSEYDLDQIFLESSAEFKILWKKTGELFQQIRSRISRDRLSECRMFLLSCLQRFLLSILIDSDWEAASDFMENVDTVSKQPAFETKEIFRGANENFEVYMQKMRQAAENLQFTEKEKTILDARNSLQEECRQFAAHPAGVCCLPIPTGGGKTLSSLAYALEFCRLHPKTERIIYVSPYISITEQNAKVFREAIGNDMWVLEHHSSVVRNERKESGDERADRGLRYDVNWEEPFICTTFVQFMNTLFSDRSESIRRMHRLANAVVIIDEVQAMPVKCIHTFNYMINFLNAVCNTNIILCTATQPALADADCPICYSSPKYMIKNASDWFTKFERVRIFTPKPNQKYTVETLGEEIARQTAKFRSILVVLNTKSAVRNLYDTLKELNIKAEYLTTNLCAEHRSDRIASIKKTIGDGQENLVAVSTNLIEAGVDISFECVYRSMAGLDSLAQTAGRCNRNGTLAYGELHLIRLSDENTGSMTQLSENIRETEYILIEYDKSEKTDSLLMPKWMDQYYRELYASESDRMDFPIKGSDTNVMELLSEGFEPSEKKHMMNQAFRTAGFAYRIIDDDSFGVLVPYKKGAELIEKIQNTDDPGELKSLIRQAQRYTVNVRERKMSKFSGLIEAISEKIPGLYRIAAPGAYNDAYGITAEWEPLIF